MSEQIDIAGLSKAEVLAALYNAARPQGMGILQYNKAPMTIEEAQKLLDQYPNNLYFDYLKGRVMKTDLQGDILLPRLFDRDNGEGTAEAVINSLRSTGDVNNEAIRYIHAGGVRDGIETSKQMMSTKTTTENLPGMVVMHLGVDEPELVEALTVAIEANEVEYTK